MEPENWKISSTIHHQKEWASSSCFDSRSLQKSLRKHIIGKNNRMCVIVKVVDIWENLANRFVNALARIRYFMRVVTGGVFIPECLRIRPSRVELGEIYDNLSHECTERFYFTLCTSVVHIEMQSSSHPVLTLRHSPAARQSPLTCAALPSLDRPAILGAADRVWVLMRWA